MRFKTQPWFLVGVVCSIGVAHAQSNSRHFTTCKSLDSRIRIVSYNILGDGEKYALSKKHAYCPREFIETTSRYPRMIQELKSYDADLVALQEVQLPAAHEYIKAAFAPSEWAYLYSARPTRAEAQGLQLPDLSPTLSSGGDLILVKKAAFEVTATNISAFYNIPKSLAPDVAVFAQPDNEDAQRLVGELAERGDAVEMVKLKHLKSGKSLCLANTHLYFNPRFPHIKALQALMLTHAVKDFIGEEPMGLVVAGDMNSFALKRERDENDLEPPAPQGSPSGVFTLLSTGRLAASFHEHPSRRGAAAFPELRSALPPLESVYTKATGAEPPITTKTTTFSGNIDQIFSSNVKVLGVLTMPYDDPANFGAIPDKVWPSDHLALGVDIEL